MWLTQATLTEQSLRGTLVESANAASERLATERLFESFADVYKRPSLYAVFLNFLLYQKTTGQKGDPAPLVCYCACASRYSRASKSTKCVYLRR